MFSSAPIDLLWILAHPDDESFGNAGTMLLARDAGMTTGLICATRGEAGEIRDPSLATRLTLGAVRERELRHAMRLAKLDELRLLGYRDSGMIGSIENDDPRSLVSAPFEEVVASIVAQIRDLRPRVVITFGPDGAYGHPDHIRIGAATDTATVTAAGNDHPGLGHPWQIDTLYHVAIPRERIIESANNPESPFMGMSEQELASYGTPAADITHWINCRSKYAEKHAILMQHLTQISRDNPMTDPDNQAARAFLGRETYARQPLPWEVVEQDPLSVLNGEFPGFHDIYGEGTREQTSQ